MQDRWFRFAVSLGIAVVMLAWSPLLVHADGKKTRQARRIAATRAARLSGVRPASNIGGCVFIATFKSADYDNFLHRANAYWAISCNLGQVVAPCVWSWTVNEQVWDGQEWVTDFYRCADDTSACGDSGPNFHTWLDGVSYPHGTRIRITWTIQLGPCAAPTQSIAVAVQNITIP